MSDQRRWPAPWLFSLLILPLGIVVGFRATPLPFLLAKAGLPVDRIATVSAIANVPAFLFFLWGPLVDIKLRRRTWLAVGTFGAALAACAYFPLIGVSHVTLMTVFILVGGIGEALIFSACGGVMVRTLSAAAQVKASAWWQAGMQGGGALGGAAILWLASRMSLPVAGFCTAVLIALPGLLAFSISEPKPAASPWFQGRVTRIAREFWEVLRTPVRRWSTLLILGPGGTGAAMFLLPAIASHYGVGAAGVTWINGVGGGVLMALGALCGVLVPGDWDRRLTYAGAGLLNALGILVLLVTSRPSTYAMGTAIYLVTNGLCQAQFVSLVAEIVGGETRDASTLFTALGSAGLFSTTYMIWVEGVGYRHFGTRGLLWTEAGGSLLVFAIVLAVFVICRLGLRRAPQIPASETSAP